MKLENFLEQIEKEHEVRTKDVTLFDLVLVSVSLVPVGLELLSSFKYFYENYFIYSIAGSVILAMITFYYLPKYYEIKLKELHYFLFSIFFAGLTFFFIPKFAHIFILNKNFQCISATLVGKSFLGSDQKGSIKFDIIYEQNTPKEFIGYHSLRDIPKDEYEQLPSHGSKINICGDLSKICFSFDYIEAVKDKNGNVVP